MKILAISLAACSLVFAGEHWNVDAGGVSMKYLSMQTSARAAGLSGAGVADAEDVLAAFQTIADGKYAFISRGDNSGTHTKELSLWPESLGITAEPESYADYTEWYISANAGMGACLVMAEEMGAYILTDKATFLTFVANDGVMD